ncbi:hypothetical protein FHR22_001501 [Sphingopyxis panaciterrae]|nr:hypothetical protein [Sphingopyxis panaciterrae]
MARENAKVHADGVFGNWLNMWIGSGTMVI